MAAALALAAGSGTFLLYTALVLGWRGLRMAPSVAGTAPGGRGAARRTAARLDQWLAQAGLEGVPVYQFTTVMAALFAAGVGVAMTLFGGVIPALVAGGFAATFPPASYRARREHRRAEARDAWPRLIEEIRLQTGSLGRSIPQALFEVGRRAPDELRQAFAVAERQWLLTTDMDATVAVLQQRLADATADAVLETLLVAHQVGGSDLDRRLVALWEDRVQDLQGRKDARAKQAGVRFARRFVLAVPLGMAVAGLSIGTGRRAYQTPLGQTAVATALVLVAACWAWAGRLLRLPDEERVFGG
jgi:tight adherence protein B